MAVAIVTVSKLFWLLSDEHTRRYGIEPYESEASARWPAAATLVGAALVLSFRTRCSAVERGQRGDETGCVSGRDASMSASDTWVLLLVQQSDALGARAFARRVLQ